MRATPLLLWILACNRSDIEVVDRAPGARAPIGAECDPEDETLCLLPWPSSRYLKLDDSTGTGLRLDIEASALPAEDDPSWLNHADGFSRMTGLAAAWSTRLDASTLASALHLVNAEPGETWGEEVPLYTEVVSGGSSLTPMDLLVGRPRRPMAAGSEHLVYVLDDLRDAEGGALPRSRWTELALGLIDPVDEDEARWVGYHAPARALLDDLGVDRERVLRLWDFTTRSQDDPWKRLDALRAADEAVLDAGDAWVQLDALEIEPARDIAFIAEGRLMGLPEYRDDDGRLHLGDDELALPLASTREVVFRAVVPAGHGDYPVTLYGHGTGGEFTDDSFDEAMAANGLAKLGLRWEGWTGDEVIQTVSRMASEPLGGTEISTASLLISAANAHALLEALDGPLGRALASEYLNQETNPSPGRFADTSEPLWIGGSQGGTMGAVVSLSSERIRFGVLNVPGGGWSHFIAASSMYSTFEGAVLSTFGDPVPAALAILMTQSTWDEVDGAVWADRGAADDDVYLLQESIGDPVLPNIGTEMLASSLGATLMTPDIEAVEGLETSAEPIEFASGLEQFRVPDTDELDIHGFAARDTEAAEAAMEQIFVFVTGALAGTPRVEHPASCAEASESGACDWSGGW